MSVYRDRHDDARSTVSRRDDSNVTRVTRYIIRDDDEDDTRSTYTTRSRREVEEPRSRVPEYVERDLVVRTRHEPSRSPRREHRHSRDFRDEQDDKEITIRRTVETGEPKREERDLTITRVEERRDDTPSSRDRYWERDRDLQHYTRTSEYYGPPHPQPQTIIIRQEPIIIRERVRDDDYQMVRKSDADEERSVVRRDEPRDEEYFYEKKVKERIEDPRDRYDDRRSRRDISPGDSVSQAGRRRDRSYSSDDSMVYVRKVREGYDSRGSSPDHKKNLAAGVIAGVGAAELLRSHKKKEGKDAAHGIGRVGRDVGAGAIGALAAEGISRARSLHRERSQRRHSRDRSYSSERGDRYGRSRSRHRRSRSRSRSQSHSRLKTLGALGLGAVAVAAAATVASKKMNQNKEQPERRRSRSRRRRGSVESLEALENDPDADDARNPRHRNQRIAAAGAVGAAGAALIERARSRGRDGRDRSRSQSRIRQGLPIAAAGLGTAALAGLYERNKAKREAEKVQHGQRREAHDDRRSRSRGGGRSRSQAAWDDDEDGHRGGPRQNDDYDQYFSYGKGPMYGNNFRKGDYGQGPAQEPYYNPQAMVPVDGSRDLPREARARSRSFSREPRGGRSISPGSETERHRGRDAAGLAGAAAAAGGVAGSQHERRKQEKRERKARRREQERGHSNDPYYDDGYGSQNFNTATPPPVHDPYAQFYNNSASQLPPPPGPLPQQQYASSSMPQAFGPGPFPQSQPQPQPQPAMTPNGSYQPPMDNSFGGPPAFNNNAGDPYGGQNFPPTNVNTPQPPFDPAHAPGPNQYGGAPRNRGADENVSAGSTFPQQAPNEQHETTTDGVKTSRSPSRPPDINIVPPSATDTAPPSSSSIPNLTVPSTYNLPNERSNERRSDSPGSKRVQFAPATEATRSTSVLSSHTTDTEAMSPDDRRHRRQRSETNQGYEASEDTDTSPADDPRSRAYDMRSERDRAEQGQRSRSNSHRDRNNDRSRDGSRSLDGERSRDDERNRDRDRDRDRKDRDSRRSSRHKSRHGDQSDADETDATIELEPRFDEKGRKKPERGEDPLADQIDDILAGKGTAGKVFGNFMDGLVGSDKGKGPDKRRRD